LCWVIFLLNIFNCNIDLYNATFVADRDFKILDNRNTIELILHKQNIHLSRRSHFWTIEDDKIHFTKKKKQVRDRKEVTSETFLNDRTHLKKTIRAGPRRSNFWETSGRQKDDKTTFLKNKIIGKIRSHKCFLEVKKKIKRKTKNNAHAIKGGCDNIFRPNFMIICGQWGIETPITMKSVCCPH